MKYPAIIDHGAAVGFSENFINMSAKYLKKNTKVTVMEETEMISLSNGQ